jgi:hypothetical protein
MLRFRRRTKQDVAELLVQLVALVPPFPQKTSLLQLQSHLSARYQQRLTRQLIAQYLRQALRDRRIARLGGRNYTKPANGHERTLALNYVKPVVRKLPRHQATPGLRSQLQALNAAYENKFLRSSQNPLTTPE